MIRSYFKLRISLFLRNIATLHHFLINFLIIFFLVGVIFFKANILIILAVIFILALSPLRVFKVLGIIALLTGILFTRDYYYQVTKDIARLSESNIKVSGIIIEPPSENLFSFDSILRIEDSKSLLIAKLPKNSELNYGDQIIVSGKIVELNSLNTDYKNYLNSKGVFLEIKNPKYELDKSNKNVLKVFSGMRELIVDSINRHLFEPEASLFNGIVLGKKDNLKDSIKEDLKLTGTSHIISASGFNVVTVYVLLSSLSNFFDKRKVNIFSIFVLTFYILLIGIYNLPALRATIMLIYMLIGKYNGRKVSAFSALLVSITFITLINPLSILNISMQLSVFATLGLFSFSNTFNKFFKRLNLNKSFSEILGSTIGASIFTIPLIWINFKEVSLIAIPVNILVLPLVPIITYLGMFAIFVLFLNINIVSEIVFWPIHKLLEAILNIVNLSSGASIRTSEIGFILYFLLLTLTILLIDYRNYVFKIKKHI